MRLAIKVKVKSGNFQTPPLNHTSVPDLRYTEIGEIVLSCLENMTFYDYRYIHLSKKIDFFSVYFLHGSFSSILFLLFSNEILFLACKTFKLYRDIYTEENLKFVIHVYWYYTLYTFVHYHELVPCVQTKASRDLSRILTINLELTLASPSIN